MTVLVMMVPFILLAMMLVLQFGIAYYGQRVLAGAVQDGASTAALEGSSLDEGLAVTNRLIERGGAGWVVDPSVGGSSTGDIVTINATGRAIRLVPLLPTIGLSATASASIEQFVPQGSRP